MVNKTLKHIVAVSAYITNEKTVAGSIMSFNTNIVALNAISLKLEQSF